MLQPPPPPPPPQQQQQQQSLVSVQHGERYDNVSLVESLGNTATTTTTTTTTTSRHSHLVISKRSQITTFYLLLLWLFLCLFGWWVDFVCLLACLLACLLICFCFFSFHQFKFKARVIKQKPKTTASKFRTRHSQK